MDEQDNIIITMGIGYKTSVESRQNYFDSMGQLDTIAILDDLTREYRQMKDEELIQELKLQKVLFKQSLDRYYASEIAGEMYDRMIDFQAIQIKRQLLTNAYALNHGAGLICVKQISILEDNILNAFQTVILFFYSYQELFNEDLSGSKKMKMQRLVSDFFSNESYLRHLDQFNMSYLKKYLVKFGMHDISGRKVVDNIINDTAIGAVEVTVKLIFEDEKFKKLCEYFDLIRGKLNDMIKCGQFPPYGVALAIDYEDNGQRVLPWHGRLSEHTIAKLRQKMHTYVHKQVDAYNVILAAYCNMCFNDEPTIAMVKLEFDTVPHNKGSYSRHTSKKFSTYKRYVEQGWTAQIDKMVINEPFYSSYCELKEILKST